MSEQVINEIAYYLSHESVKPSVYIGYTRKAFFAKDDPEFRLTFDSKILNQLVKDIVNYDDKIFSGRRQIVLYQANLDKFRYNIELKNQLLATNDAVIALCNKYDLVNGIGLNVDDSRIYKTKNWLGSNLHGFSLMEVRSTLKKEG